MAKVHDWVAYNASVHPETPAATSVERGVTLTWGELERRVGRLSASLLQRYGLAPGDRVALIAENDVRIFELQFACMRAGLILVPINWRLALGEMVTLMRDAEPRLLISDDTWKTTADALAEAIPFEARLAWSDTPGTSEYDELIETADCVLPGGMYDADTLTHILYTSGTTGLPKGALCSHRSLQAQALNLAHTSRMAERGNHHLNIVPMFHAGALNTYSNPTLYWGGQVTTVRRFDAAVALRLLTDPEVGITHLCGVLQMYEMITALPEFERATFPTLRKALFGGWGPSTRWVHETWRKRGFFLQLSYGSTECGPNVCILDENEELASRNCSGNIVASTEVRLVDRDGADVPQGEVGEIWVRGPAITPGYWRRPKEDYFQGDWFKTGDCVRADEAGRLFIVDRLREVYRSGGENIYPAEVELVLSQAPNVKEVAVIAVPDTRWGEVGLAVIEPHAGATVTLDMLLSYAEGKLGRFKLPKHMVTIETMPRSATLKIDRAALKKAYSAAPPV